LTVRTTERRFSSFVTRTRVPNGSSFEPLRDKLVRVIESFAPRSIACLGAGVLNDIPLHAWFAPMSISILSTGSQA
jgi:hypothetical protein